MHGVFGAAACSYKDTIYTSGGRPNFTGTVVYDDMYAYIPVNKKWRKLATMPYACCLHAMVNSGSNIYVIGGENSKEEPLRTACVYNPDNNQWTRLTLQGIGRELQWNIRSVCGYNNTIYVIGRCKDSGEIYLFHLQSENNVLTASGLTNLNFVGKIKSASHLRLCWK